MNSIEYKNIERNKQRIGKAILKCNDHMKWLEARIRATTVSLKTQFEYNKLAKILFARAQVSGCLQSVINDTVSIRTYYKRVAAYQRYFLWYMDYISKVVKRDINKDNNSLNDVIQLFEDFVAFLPEFRNTVNMGFQGVRAKPDGKRKSLSGLPFTWLEDICKRGINGKYRLPLLVCSAIGCRPSELQKGVAIGIDIDHEANCECLYFMVNGSKVREHCGQPEIVLTIPISEDDYVTSKLAEIVRDNSGEELIVRVENSGNFSKEITRLAKCLWPKHKHNVSAISMRHQFSSSGKRSGDGEIVSRALGHRSAKTKKRYGVASQGRSNVMPIKVQTTFPLKHLNGSFKNDQSNDPKP